MDECSGKRLSVGSSESHLLTALLGLALLALNVDWVLLDAASGLIERKR